MPFADDAFGGAYLRWVLHLIPDWRAALVESWCGWFEPGGVLLVYLGAFDEAEQEIRPRFAELDGRRDRPGRPDSWGDHEVLDVELASLGARAPPSCRRSPRKTRRPLGEFLDAIEEGR